jgi:spore germination cell wall hydrolase CwlJ-like protein
MLKRPNVETTVLAGYNTDVANALTLPRPRPLLRDVASRAAALWRAYPRESLGVGLFALVAAAAIATTSLAPQHSPAGAAPPAPPPMTVRPLAPDQALKVNAEIPVAGGPNPAAAAFQFKGNAAARAQALNCLASAVYYEAGNQDGDGERAVAQVVLNRVRHPAFPGTVCGVVYQGSTRPTGCQFTFTCDGSLNRQPDADGWRRASAVAEAALGGTVYAPVGWATHYHADYVVPYWAATMAKNTVVGLHLFYRWPGSWGQPSAFTKDYGGHEPSAVALRAAALAAVHVIAQQPGSLAAAIEKIPGAEPLKLSPSMRGDKRVGVRFNLVARKASAEVKPQDYSQKYGASDNLKWSLSNDAVADNQQPLGKRSASGASGAN